MVVHVQLYIITRISTISSKLMIFKVSIDVIYWNDYQSKIYVQLGRTW